jgi:hypothetical protein
MFRVGVFFVSAVCPFVGAPTDPPVLFPLKAFDFARALDAATACIAAPSTDFPMSFGRRITAGLAILLTGAGIRSPFSDRSGSPTDTKSDGSVVPLVSAGATEADLGFSSTASDFGDKTFNERRWRKSTDRPVETINELSFSTNRETVLLNSCGLQL